MMRPGTTVDVFLSINSLALRSTINPCFSRKSAPSIGLSTAAMVNRHFNSLPRPKSSSRILVPNVSMRVPFAANRISCGLGWVLFLTGMTEMFAPVSTKNRRRFLLSLMNRRCDDSALTSAPVSAEIFLSFPTSCSFYMVIDIFLLLFRTFDGRSRFASVKNSL